MTTGPAQLRETFLGRQPILDRDQTLFGYELLFRTSAENRTQIDNASSSERATAEVVCAMFTELGLADVLGPARSFINAGAEFLSSDFVSLLPAACVVLEVDIDAFSNTRLLPRCQELKAQGYAFSVSGITDASAALAPIFDLATWLKIDIGSVAHDRLQTIVHALTATRHSLIASRVETPSQRELCLLLGFDLFQGYYFAHPEVIQGRTLDASTQGILRLLHLLTADAGTTALETAFCSEPALIVNLLRLVNSVGVGLRNRVTSIRQAITVIGRKPLQRWLQLLLFSHGQAADPARNPLLQLAALRARLMELLARRLHPAAPQLADEAFLTGLVSLLPAALGLPLEEVIKQLALADDISLALTQQTNAIGKLLRLLERYDDGDFQAIGWLLAGYTPAIDAGVLNQLLTEALVWVQQLDTES
ncbi:MAG: EAL domain-containing protein [Rugosibacter sp.]|nr:EAL domain-containing protein [Rugosibacter sp.]